MDLIKEAQKFPVDSIKTQKLEAMKRYRKAQFLYNLIVYSLTAFLSCLFYLYLFWFPSTSMKHFISVFVPNIYSFFSSPALLFIVGNVIVLFLVGEAKLRGGGGGSRYSSPANEIYDEYVRRSQSLRESSLTVEQKKKDKKAEMHRNTKKSMIKMDEKRIHTDHHVVYAEKKRSLEIVVQEEQTNKKGGERDAVAGKVVSITGENLCVQDEKVGMLARDELNRRVEDFIARVNRQRMLEERQVVHDRW